ncbi:sedoheptulokinase [Echinops telfairi]|uniref:Sedoheptulokinase n=1 Tax=Echinops telfairi TaxID=9371 RepID=A0AC55DC06_ECHTE|nr:sedoheptulokinase [Echinops telfairi]
MAAPSITLGIDLGTTSVKAALLEAAPGDPSGFVVLASCARASRAEVATESAAAGTQGREQDVSRILQALHECLAALPRQELRKVGAIGVSGQMHGVVFWKTGQGCEWTEGRATPVFESRTVSHLVTWQDGRCSSGFLASLPQPESHLSVATGFGCSTIFWLLKNSQLARPNLCSPWSLVLNISTSVQLAASMPSGFQPVQTPDPLAPVAYFPYFNRSYLGVAASLNGGNVLATFVHMLVQWMAELGLGIEESTVYSHMIQAAAQQEDTCLTITPTVLGERHLPDQLASVTRISSSDLSLGHGSSLPALSGGRHFVQFLHQMLCPSGES